MTVGIIGAGASGMAAAIAAAQKEDTKVVLLERQGRVGRKLQATGNGRCNLSNLQAGKNGYHGEDAQFSAYALEKFPVEETLAWFSSLGLYTVIEPSGKVYPYSDQANSVVDVLRFALEKENIQLKCGAEVQKVKKCPQGFQLITPEETIEVDKLIVACGGIAGSKLGGTMSGYQLLRSLGHKSSRLRPSLVQIQSAWSGIAALKGVRANCQVEILKDGKCFAQSRGEIQFTQLGLSGPVIFEISRDVCQGKGCWEARLDFLPELSREALLSLLKLRQQGSLKGEELFTGILHNRLGRVLCQAAEIPMQREIRQLREEDLLRAADMAKAFPVSLTEPLGMDSAQVTAGGILTKDFDPKTMESRQCPGLYACGEVLDIDGDCGGYNLQWAWSSGRLAGSSAGGNL